LGDGYEAFFFAAHSPPDASLGVATERTGSGSAVILVRTVDLLELNTGPFRVEGLEAVADQDGEKTGPLERRDYRPYMGRTHLPGPYAGTYGTTPVEPTIYNGDVREAAAPILTITSILGEWRLWRLPLPVRMPGSRLA
jgi:hypothetical protein